jgi:hypothetical protein
MVSVIVHFKTSAARFVIENRMVENQECARAKRMALATFNTKDTAVHIE